MCNKNVLLYERKQLTAQIGYTYCNNSVCIECDINGICNQHDSDDSEEYDFEEMAKKPKLLLHNTYIESHKNKNGCHSVTTNKFPRRGYNVSFTTPITVIELHT